MFELDPAYEQRAGKVIRGIAQLTQQGAMEDSLKMWKSLDPQTTKALLTFLTDDPSPVATAPQDDFEEQNLNSNVSKKDILKMRDELATQHQVVAKNLAKIEDLKRTSLDRFKVFEGYIKEAREEKKRTQGQILGELQKLNETLDGLPTRGQKGQHREIQATIVTKLNKLEGLLSNVEDKVSNVEAHWDGLLQHIQGGEAPSTFSPSSQAAAAAPKNTQETTAEVTPPPAAERARRRLYSPLRSPPPVAVAGTTQQAGTTQHTRTRGTIKKGSQGGNATKSQPPKERSELLQKLTKAGAQKPTNPTMDTPAQQTGFFRWKKTVKPEPEEDVQGLGLGSLVDKETQQGHVCDPLCDLSRDSSPEYTGSLRVRWDQNDTYRDRGPTITHLDHEQIEAKRQRKAAERDSPSPEIWIDRSGYGQKGAEADAEMTRLVQEALAKAGASPPGAPKRYLPESTVSPTTLTTAKSKRTGSSLQFPPPLNQ